MSPLFIFLIVSYFIMIQNPNNVIEARYLPTRSDRDKVAELRGLIEQILESSNESNNLRPRIQQFNKSAARHNFLNRWSALMNNPNGHNGNNAGLYNNNNNNNFDISQMIGDNLPITKQFHSISTSTSANNQNLDNNNNNRLGGLGISNNNINTENGVLNPSNYPKSLRMILGTNGGIYDNDRSLN